MNTFWRRSQKQPIAAQRLLYLGGLALVPLLSMGFFLNASSSGTVTDPVKAELAYAMHSLATGVDGGSVIPASCDSGVPHLEGDTNDCLNWVTYCTGGNDIENPWEWWQYTTNRYSDTWYREVGPGTGEDWNCVPPPPDWITPACSFDGSSVTLSWAGVQGTNRFAVRLGGIRQDQCNAIASRGFSWVDGVCINNDVRGNMLEALPLDTSSGAKWHNFWVHSEAPSGGPGYWGTAREKWFICPLPQPNKTSPTNVRAECASDGNSMTVRWDHPGADQFYPRITGLTSIQCAVARWTWNPLTGECSTDSWPGNTPYITFPSINPSATFNFQVYAGDPVDPTVVPGSVGPFMCEVSPVGNLDGGSCDSNNGVLWGWACDRNAPGQRLLVRVYQDDELLSEVLTSMGREDVAEICGSGDAQPAINFNLLSLPGVRDGISHTYKLYAVDNKFNTVENSVLLGTQSVTCPAGFGMSDPTVKVEAYRLRDGQSEDVALQIDPNDEVVVTWSSTDTDSCEAIAGSGFVAEGIYGSRSVTEPAPGTSDTYTVRCRSIETRREAQDSVTVTTNNTISAAPPEVDITTKTPLIRKGQSAVLSWTVTTPYDVECRLTGGGIDELVGEYAGDLEPHTVTFFNSEVALYNATDFTLTCNAPSGNASSEVSDTIRVNVVPDLKEI